MALVPENISVDFGGNLDTKTDPKLVVPGSFLELTNAVRRKGKAFSKRDGLVPLSRLTTTGTDLPDGDALGVFSDELLYYGAQKLFSYSETLDAWVDKGDCPNAVVQTKQIIKNTNSQTIVDSAMIGNLAIYAWEDSSGGIRAAVYDEATGTTVLANTEVHATATRPRCVAFSSFFFVFYYVSGALKVKRLNPQAPSTFDSEVTISSTINTTNPTYDVTILSDNRMVFAHNVQGASEIKVGLVSYVPVTLSSPAAVTIAEAGTNSIGIVIGPQNRIYVAYHNGTNGLRCTVLDTSLAQVVAPATVDSTTSPTVVNITGYKQRDLSGVKFFYQLSAVATYNHFIKTNTLSTAGTAGTAAALLRSVGLASKAFVYYADNDATDRAYFMVVHESTLQSTYFLIRNDGAVVAKMQPGVASGLTTRPILANVSNPEDGLFYVAVTNKGELEVESGVLFTLKGVARVKLDFDHANVFKAAQLGSNLHIVGGILSMYDGQSVVEHGFHLYPENLSASQAGSAGLADGTYQYVAVFEWTDNSGQVHRSAPSEPKSFTVSGGPREVSVVVPTLRLTAKKSSRSAISVVLYRTEISGEIFYRVSSVTSPTLNTTTSDTVTIVDTTADADLVFNEILYTTGGVIENIAPPACNNVVEWKNRLVLTGLENDNEIWISKERQEGAPVEFSDLLAESIPQPGGGVTAPVVIDDKLLTFKKDRPYLLAGEPANNTGQLASLSRPEEVTIDIGVSEPNSIARLPIGFVLKSEKGIHLLDRSLQPSYIGADVEDWNDYEITSAVLKSTDNQIYFTTETGPALIYDYDFNAWSTFSNYKAKDAVRWKSSYVVLKSTGDVMKETPGVFKDASAHYGMRVVTSWLALAGVQGFQRVYRFALLGEYKSSHVLRVKVAYDYSVAYTETFIFNPQEGLEISAYGDDAVYGESVYGGPGLPYQFRGKLKRQKCQAIKFLIEDLTESSPSGTQEAMTMANLTLNVGLKRGINKMSKNQSIEGG